MLPNLKGYYRPKSISEALALLQKNSGTIVPIGGGTKLVLSGDEQVRELVDITALDLDYIREESGVMRIGTATALQKLVDSSMLRNFNNGLIADAAHLAYASRMIRNVSTVGGELVASKPLSILYCAFLALQAQVRIAGGEEFALAMNIFLNKKGLGGGILIEVLVPVPTLPSYASLSYIGAPASKVPLLCGCARVTVEEGRCESVKLGMTGTAPVPQRLHAVELLLEGKRFTPQNIEQACERVYEIYNPVTDPRASAEYRKEVARLVITRALHQCLEHYEDDLS